MIARARWTKIVDRTTIVAVVALAQLIRFGSQDWAGSTVVYTAISVGVVILWCGFLAHEQAYDHRLLGRGLDEYRRVIIATVKLFGGVAIISVVVGQNLARGYLAIALPLGLSLLLAGRWIARRSLARGRMSGRYGSRVLLVGSSAAALSTIESISRAPELGYRVVGLCIPNYTGEANRAIVVAGVEVPILGGSDDIVAAIDACRADTVAVTDTDRIGPERMRDIGWALHERGVDLVVAPLVTDFAGPRLRPQSTTGLSLIHVDEPSYRGIGRVGKFVLDWVGAAFGLILLSPLLVGIAVAIKLEDGGPVFYRQTRVGKGNREFRMWKFRSMRVDADAALAALRAERADDSAFFKDADDPRITRIGRFLRSTSLDELPQLFNVVSGEMSLVGPRPMVPGEGAQFDGFVERRLLVRPGMTGLWQVSGRSNLTEDERVRLDLFYVENFSLVQDALIMAKTLRAVTARDGAY